MNRTSTIVLNGEGRVLVVTLSRSASSAKVGMGEAEVCVCKRVYVNESRCVGVYM